MLKNINAVLSDEPGQGLVEYGLILTFVAIAAIAALTGLGTGIKATQSSPASSFCLTAVTLHLSATVNAAYAGRARSIRLSPKVLARRSRSARMASP